MLKFLYSEDAVSEVVDFVTILGILVISLGIIGVAGYPMVKNAQEANYIENTKQSFIVLAENVNKVVQGQAPSQNVEVKLYGGTLSANGTSEINVTATNSNGQQITLIDQQMRSIESTVGNTVIAYQGTAVWAKYPGGRTLMFSKPLITSLNNTSYVIPAVRVLGTTSVGGNGMSRVVVSGGVPGILAPDIDFYKNMSNITVTINSTYYQGWYNYLNNTLGFSCTNNMQWSSVNCKIQTQNADVYILKIDLNTMIT